MGTLTDQPPRQDMLVGCSELVADLLADLEHERQGGANHHVRLKADAVFLHAIGWPDCDIAIDVGVSVAEVQPRPNGWRIHSHQPWRHEKSEGLAAPRNGETMMASTEEWGVLGGM